MTLRPAVGNLRRETARYGGLLNLLAARFASQRLARHPNVSAPAGAVQIRHTTRWTLGPRGRIIIHPGGSLSLDLRGGAGFDWRLDRGLLQVLDGTLEVFGAVCWARAVASSLKTAAPCALRAAPWWPATAASLPIT